MRESLRIDSPFMGAGMPKAYSRDLRERVITAVETGASRREAAERFEVSVASAVKWLQRWYQQRSAAPKPRGGRFSKWLFRQCIHHDLGLRIGENSTFCCQCGSCMTQLAFQSPVPAIC